MDIVISKEIIKEALKKESSLISKGAYSDKGVSLYDTVYIDEQEFDLLSSAYDDALSTIVSLMREFFTSNPVKSGDTVTFSLWKSDAGLVAALADDIHSYIAKRMMTQWLRTVYPTDSLQYENAASSVLSNISLKLYHKNPPTR